MRRGRYESGCRLLGVEAGECGKVEIDGEYER
jgi:hypothetical protein